LLLNCLFYKKVKKKKGTPVETKKPQFNIAASYTPPAVAPIEGNSDIANINQELNKLEVRELPANARPAREEGQK
jgi:hypothetical protein